MTDGIRVTRRTALLTLAAAAGTTTAFCSQQGGRPSLTFVLVHGAWHGGWCWKRVAPLLRVEGHQVYTPTLTGLGERRHLAGPQVNLSTHIQDIVEVLEFEDLRDVILVGHSYAGFVIAGVATQARTRLAHLLFLDAFLPEDGKRMMDYNPDIVPPKGDEWRLPLPFPLDVLGVTDPADVAWETSKITDQPFATFSEPLKLPADSFAGLKRSYLLATKGEPFEPAATRATAAGFKVSSMTDAGHMVMVTRPRELATRLVELAS